MNQPTKFSLVHITKKRRNKHPERDLHKTLGEYLDRSLPDDAWHTAIPGGDGRVTTHPAYRSGAPDHLVLWNRQPFFFELKAPDSKTKPSAVQTETHKRINWAGASVLVARSVKAVEQYLIDKGVPLRGRVQ